MGENSRKFSIVLTILLFIAQTSGQFRLQIVHNSDVHAKFEQMNANYGLCTEEDAARGKCYGGFARTKAAIEMAKEEAKAQQIPTIVLNAGDYFVGSAYYDLKKWEIAAPLVNALQYDVLTVGNHDFDDGIQNLVNFINHVNAPVVCCNLDLTTEPRLAASKLKSSHVLNVNGTEIGVIGFVTTTTMNFSQTEKLIILEEVPSIRAEIEKLQKKGVNIFIALSHSGMEEDVKIACEVPELSLIVGGHTHLLLHNIPSEDAGEPSGKERRTSEDYVSCTRKDVRLDIEKIAGEYPRRVLVASGKVIPIVHAHAYTKYLGKLIPTFDDDGKVTSTSGNTILLDSKIPEDESTKKYVESLLAPLRPLVKEPIAFTRVPLKPVNFEERQFESTLANLVADALIDHAVQRAAEAGLKEWTTASIVLLNIYGYFQELGYDGRISLEDVLSTFMAGNNVVEVTYPGSVIKDALEYSIKPRGETYNFPNFLHVSGLRVVYDFSKPVDQRIESLEALCLDCIVPRYEILNTNQNYKVILPVYLAHGHQGFDMFTTNETEPVKVKVTIVNIVRDYLQRMRMVYPVWDGRITVKNVDSLSPTPMEESDN